MRYAINELFDSRCSNVPKTSGVYFVKAPNDFKVEICETSVSFESIKNKLLLYNKSLLNDKYEKLKEKEILYIGKANCKNGLHERIKQYIMYGYKKSKIHQGGRAIWQIDKCENLIIEFYEMHRL